MSCNFYSRALKRNTRFYAALPKEIVKGKLQVLYLLHGGGDNETKWLRRVPIERIFSGCKVLVIMPDGGLSYYTNTVCGENYWTYLSEELPKVVKTYFPVSEKREDTFAAGLSMGGYGAMKLALKQPERFAKAAAFSGSLDMVREIEVVLSDTKDREDFLGDYEMDETFYTSIFGNLDKVKGSPADIYHLLEKYRGKAEGLPEIYQCCGTEDFLYRFNLIFKEALLDLGARATFEEWTGGHDWVFWEEALRRAVRWFSFKNDYISCGEV
ncbi:MAG: esterase family protein [Anaerostipes sp.]|nr:esterase family protein [Anaerostipes sp.]